MARIAVIEDERDLQAVLDYNLRQAGYEVIQAVRGNDGLALVREKRPDLVILDLMLPDVSGTEICKALKRDPATQGIPILMLTARGEEIDRVVGLEVGADDYLAKPFSPRELLARLRALLRRAQAAPPEAAREALAFGPYRLDVNARRLLRGQEDVGLSTAEFELMQAFAERPNRVLSRDVLLDLLKGYERDPFDRTIDIRVGRLRRKIEADPGNPSFIRTVRGEGYLFNPHGDAS